MTVSDFRTPEGAVRRLEDAYRAKDVEAAIRCKNFEIEAKLMFERLKRAPAAPDDQSRIAQLAEVLEQAFRNENAEKGFADMTGVESSFPDVEPLADGVVVVTEVCRYPDGQTSRHRLIVASTPDGWRVLGPAD